MASVTAAQRLYFVAVGALAVWVGLWGYFIPQRVDIALPWLVPPLHARFLGAMYLSGTAFMIGCVLARYWSEVAVVVIMVAIWTGLLFVVSLFHLHEFDFTRTQVWIWFGAYLIYPLIALWLAWMHAGRVDASEPASPTLPYWVRIYLWIQGTIATVFALTLLVAPDAMASVWPWKITPLLAHIYSAPFFSYGVGSLLLSRRYSWRQVRIAIIAMWVFVFGVLIASLIHRELFSSADLADGLWFSAFAVTTVMLSAIALQLTRKPAAPY